MVSGLKAKVFIKLRKENPDFSAKDIKDIIDSFSGRDMLDALDHSNKISENYLNLFKHYSKSREMRSSLAAKIVYNLSEEVVNFHWEGIQKLIANPKEFSEEDIGLYIPIKLQALCDYGKDKGARFPIDLLRNQWLYSQKEYWQDSQAFLEKVHATEAEKLAV